MKEYPFEVWVGNLAKYTEGNLEGKWIPLPQSESRLKEIMDEITNFGRDEAMIMDVSVQEQCFYLKDMIGEWTNVYDLNVVAQLIGEKEHEAVQAYMEAVGTENVTELANLLVQEETIPYFSYEFEGCENPEVMQNLSAESKMGYTIIESTPGMRETLDALPLGTATVLSYVDAEAIGRDLSLSDYVHLNEKGYYDKQANAMDLSKYSMDEIKEYVREMETSVQKQKQPGIVERSPSL